MSAEKIDLGLIQVVSDGKRDLVYLAHNQLKVFSLYCEAGKPSRLRINKKFYEYDHRQWDQVFLKYLEWKRTHSPNFKLPHYSGRKLDGSRHPWRRLLHPEQAKPAPNDKQPPAQQP
jgi:hypothetical protein